MHGEIAAIGIIIAIMSPALLAIFMKHLVQLRQAGSASRKEITELRQTLADFYREYQQMKADHNITLLGLERAVQRLEERLDRHAGIEPDVAAPEAQAASAARPPTERQL